MPSQKADQNREADLSGAALIVDMLKPSKMAKARNGAISLTWLCGALCSFTQRNRMQTNQASTSKTARRGGFFSCRTHGAKAAPDFFSVAPMWPQ